MRRVSFSSVAAVVASLGIVPILTLALRRGVEIPYWDEWEWTDLVYAAHTHTLTFAQLWAPHNEHRVLIPNLLMLGLDAIGGWSIVREQAVSLAILALTQLLAWGLIRRTVPGPSRGVCFLAVTVVLFGLAQYENLGWGFQMGWFICNLGLLAAVWALTRPRRGALDVTFAVLAATTASVSLSQGLLIWLAGLICILCLPRRNTATAFVWIAAAGVVTAIVRSGSPGDGAIGHVALAHNVALLVQYCLIYLGAPLALSFDLSVAMWAGVFFVVWTIVLAMLWWRSGPRRRVRFVPWVALFCYAVAAGAVTASARAGFGIVQADASRYTSISSLGWIALLAATFAVASRRELVRRALVPVMAVVIASLVQSLAGNGAWKQHQIQLVRARADLEHGDAAGLPLIYPIRQRVTMLMGELSKIRDGIFTDSGR